MDSEKSGSSAKEKTSQSVCGKSSEPVSSAVRLQRNQAEKQRRDRLNGFITELANIVPMVKNSSKPVDKVSVLRLAAAHMRLNFSCLNPKNFHSTIPALPATIQSYLEIVEKNIGGFIVVTTLTGIVLFCSRCIEDFVGFQSIDLIGQSIYNYVEANEVSFFEKKVNSAIARSKKENTKTKVVKLHMLQRPLPRSTEVKYRKMLFKLSVHCNDSFDKPVSQTKSLQKLKKVKHKDFGTSSVVLMFIEPMRMEPKINRAYLLSHQDIYFTIHGLQGEIMYADQRIATITGYMPQDVQGTSAYQYILDNDVPIALFAQKAMFSSNDGTGLITYRLKIFDTSYIYLQSKGQIVFKESSPEISHFVCYNRWLSEEEGSKELKKFKERFEPQITDLKTTENLEKAQSLALKPVQYDNTDAITSLKSSEDFYSLDKTSSLTCPASEIPNNEVFGRNIYSTNLNLSYNQPPNHPATNFIGEDQVSKNCSAKNSLTHLIGSNKAFTYSSDEFNQRAPQKEINTYSVDLIESHASSLQIANSDGLGYAGKLEIPHVSSGLNGNKDFSYALLQSQDIGGSQSAFELSSPEISGIDSNNHYMVLSSVSLESRPLLGNEPASCTQLYSSVCSPVNGFYMSKQKSPNITNTNSFVKDQSKSAPAVKFAVSEHSADYSRELCISSKFSMPKYESNGHYNLGSTYASPISCKFQNFAAKNDFEGGVGFPVSGAPLQVNGTNIDLVPDCYASFSTFNDPPLKGNTSAIQNEHSMYSTKNCYNNTNGFNASKGISFGVNGNSHAEVQKKNIPKNKSASVTNDAYPYPYGIPAKRMKINEVSDSESDHIYNWLNGNAGQGLYPEINMINGANNLSQDIKTSSHARELYSTQNNAEISSFNGDLYNELDTYFEQLPLSSSTTRSQLSYVLAQSTDDNDNSQFPSRSTRNVSS